MIIKNQSKSQKHLYLDTLGSNNFPSLLEDYTLSKEVYNEFFAAHCLALTLLSSGISYGSVKIEYVLSTEDGYDFNIPTPKLMYGFYNTQNGIIQNRRLKSSNSGLRLKNPQFPQFKYSRQLCDFLNVYMHQMKPMHGTKIEDFQDYSFSLNIDKNYDRINKKDYLYANIIEKIPSLKSFLDWHFLQNKIEQKTKDISQKNRLKI